MTTQSAKKVFTVLIFSMTALFNSSCDSSSQTSPPKNLNFSDKTVLTGLDVPVALRFTQDGRIFVGEKKGTIKVFTSLKDKNPTVIADLSPQVHDFWDRGLMDLELHPDFPQTPYLYVLYAYDAPIGSIAPVYNDQDNRDSKGAASARLTRFKITTTAQELKAVEDKVLIHDWCQVYPSHSVGTVRFGKDGALYVSGGDAASFHFADWGQTENYCGDPKDEGGALRSQDLETPLDAVTLDGSIIRIDPETGEGFFDNPFATFENKSSNASRIIAYGLRNPYRFTFKPGTQELWIGDVGRATWEEVNHISNPHVPNNFGWPCYEGKNINKDYQDVTLCKALYAKQAATGKAVTAPQAEYLHTEAPNPANPCGGTGSAAISGLAFYEGTSYPARYHGALFLADYARGCIWLQYPDSKGSPDPKNQERFLMDVAAPVSLQTGPDGDLFYLAILKGELRRITYNADPSNEDPVFTGKEPSPVISLPSQEITAQSGDTVSFSGSATRPDGTLIPETGLSWKVLIKHCAEVNGGDCHTHFYVDLKNKNSGSFKMPSDHEHPSFLEIVLKAQYTVDGVSHSKEVSRKVNYAQ